LREAQDEIESRIGETLRESLYKLLNNPKDTQRLLQDLAQMMDAKKPTNFRLWKEAGSFLLNTYPDCIPEELRRGVDEGKVSPALISGSLQRYDHKTFHVVMARSPPLSETGEVEGPGPSSSLALLGIGEPGGNIAKKDVPEPDGSGSGASAGAGADGSGAGAPADEESIVDEDEEALPSEEEESEDDQSND
jgi:hypothetical protein